MARHRGIVVRALTWNLFHGRDDPPVTRVPLRGEFAAFLAAQDWEVALLQEAPPRWFRTLCTEAAASGVLVKTSRNQLGALRAWLADRRPDLMKSGEGGSNQILVRAPWRIAERNHLTLARLPERRRMLCARLERDDGAVLCVATLHASAHRPARAAREVLIAALAAAEWSADAPLVLGGDLNVRPAEEPWLFERLVEEGFTGAPTGPRRIDHLFARGLAVEKPVHGLKREVGGRVLSDHEPLVASFVG